MFGELRRSVALLASEATSRRAKDEADCVNRILARLEAETAYRREHLAERQAQLDGLIDELLAGGSAEAGLAKDYQALQARSWASADARLQESRLFLQTRLAQLAAAPGGSAQAAAVLERLDGLERQTQRDLAMRIASQPAAESPHPADAGAGPKPIDRPMMEAYLKSVFTGEPDLRVAGMSVIPGGRSKQTTLITLEEVRQLPAAIVMRRDVPGGLVPSRSADEFPLIETARRFGVPTPTPLRCEPDETRFGGTAIFVSAVPGETKGEYFPEVNGKIPGNRAIGRQLAEILARLHRIDPEAFRAPQLNPDADARRLAAETIEATYQEACRFDSPPRTTIELAYRWLMQNLERADDQLRLIHCDVGLHNMLIDGEEITALLDWELATFSSPAREIAKIMHLIDYLMPRAEFYQAYVAAGGPASAVDPRRLNFYAVMNYMVTTQRSRLASELFFSGRQPNIVMANAGYDFWARCELLLSAALEAAREGDLSGPPVPQPL